MTLACVLPGPRRAVFVVVGESRWCFGERKRLPGTYVLSDYDEDSPHCGWYEPVWVYRCDGCGQDRRLGFGRIWEDQT